MLALFIISNTEVRDDAALSDSPGTHRTENSQAHRQSTSRRRLSREWPPDPPEKKKATRMVAFCPCMMRARLTDKPKLGAC
jgi:hypothetical protein